MARRYSNKYSGSRGSRIFKAHDNVSKKNKTSHLRTLIVIIPILIVLIFGGGIYFGYLSYIKNQPTVQKIAPVATQDLVSPNDENQSELLQVVNIANPLSATYTPKLEEVNGVKVNSLAVKDLEAMLEQSKKDGVSLMVKSGYISFEDQQNLYETTKQQLKQSNNYTDVKAESETKKITPPGGNSEAQTGLLLVFASQNESQPFQKTQEYRWLEKNGINYGFILRYSKEHEEDTGMTVNYQEYRYVGKENSLRMRSYGMCLNEYQTHMLAG